jgi:aminopeptidase N
MLRRRMGDAQFFKMLSEICRRYHYQPINAEQFRAVAREFLPPRSLDPDLEEFFDHYVYGTGIPALKLEYAVRGKAPSLQLNGTLTQTGAGEDFSLLAPVEIQFGRARSMVHWVRTENGPVKFTVPLKQPPTRVALAPGEAVLARK